MNQTSFSYKNILSERMAKELCAPPRYQAIMESETPHVWRSVCAVQTDGGPVSAVGKGAKKKNADSKAAKRVLELLDAAVPAASSSSSVHLRQKIVAHLETKASDTALGISKATVGSKGTKSSVNPTLYAMMKEGTVEQVRLPKSEGGEIVTWNLSARFLSKGKEKNGETDGMALYFPPSGLSLHGKDFGKGYDVLRRETKGGGSSEETWVVKARGVV